MSNAQPFVTYNYNTDQFTDPVTGQTVHDDGSLTYTQPNTGVVYNKTRTYNGISLFSGYVSYSITLTVRGNPTGPFLVDELTGGDLLDESGNKLLAP